MLIKTYTECVRRGHKEPQDEIDVTVLCIMNT